jgi:Flp pilus assembly protein TadD
MRSGELLIQNSAYTGAEKAFSEAIFLDPGAIGAWRGRGWARHWNRAYAEAIADFDQAITLDPQEAEAYLLRGLSRSALGDNVGAQSDFARLRELSQGTK